MSLLLKLLHSIFLFTFLELLLSSVVMVSWLWLLFCAYIAFNTSSCSKPTLHICFINLFYFECYSLLQNAFVNLQCYAWQRNFSTISHMVITPLLYCIFQPYDILFLLHIWVTLKGSFFLVLKALEHPPPLSFLLVAEFWQKRFKPPITHNDCGHREPLKAKAKTL